MSKNKKKIFEENDLEKAFRIISEGIKKEENWGEDMVKVPYDKKWQDIFHSLLDGALGALDKQDLGVRDIIIVAEDKNGWRKNIKLFELISQNTKKIKEENKDED